MVAKQYVKHLFKVIQLNVKKKIYMRVNKRIL